MVADRANCCTTSSGYKERYSDSYIPTNLEWERSQLALTLPPAHFSVREKPQWPREGGVDGPSLVALRGFQSTLSYFVTKTLRE